MKLIIYTLAALSLAGCTETIVKEVPVEVKVPVAQPCAGDRPATVTSLKRDYTDEQWDQMDPKQKAAAVGHKALERQTYGEQLNAATASCP